MRRVGAGEIEKENLAYFIFFNFFFKAKFDLSVLQDTISDLRRLKFLMEQSAYSKAQDLLFEEHSVFNEKELLTDNDVPFERLGIYLNKSIKEKKMTVKEELDEKMIFQMIDRREWNENSVIYLYLPPSLYKSYKA